MSAQELFDRANQLKDNRRYQEAIQMYDEVIRRYMYKPFDALVGMIECLLGLREYREVLKICDIAEKVPGAQSHQFFFYIDYARNNAIRNLSGYQRQANTGDFCSYCFHARTDHQGGAGACSGRGGVRTGLQDYCVCGRFTP